MKVSEFAGIVSYHDGMAVSDYVNMIPMDKSCIDRLGETVALAAYPLSQGEVVLQTFVDSLRNVYIATNHCVRRYSYSSRTKQWSLSDLSTSWSVPTHAAYFINYQARRITNVTFCESSTSPSQVFICDGEFVYYLNTEQLVDDSTLSSMNNDIANRCRGYVLNLLPLGDFSDITVPSGYQYGTTDTTPGAESGYTYGWWPPMYDGTWEQFTRYYTGKLWKVSSVVWYENRLVCCESSRNLFHLSVIRPDRWIIPSNPQGQYWAPFQIYRQIDGRNVYCFVPHTYQSTASSAKLQDIVSFAGQLYLLNDTSIEIWTNTYNEDAPVQHNTMSTIHFGGRSPCIVADTLYLICKDAYHNDFIAVIGQDGQIRRISNDEIDRRIAGKADIIRPLSVRDNSFVVVYCGDELGTDLQKGLSVTKSGKWWTYDNRYVTNHKFAVWSIGSFDGKQFDVSSNGDIIEQNPNGRTHADGTPILRYVRGLFTQLPGRVIIRDVEVVCDTGISYDNSRGRMYLRLSFDRGLSFGPYLYRSLGSPGDNNRRIIWRNCGSGNSFLIEFGTSDNCRFQLYEIEFELQ